MLDKIQNNNIEHIEQNSSLESIKGFGATNPYINDDHNYFIDESRISSEAINKYQKELDIEKFGNLLKQTDQKAADHLVIEKALGGKLSVDDDYLMSELLNSKDFLNEIF